MFQDKKSATYVIIEYNIFLPDLTTFFFPAFLAITNTTVTTVVNSSGIILNKYVCEASGTPSPLTLSWLAEDRTNNNRIVTLSDTNSGVNIITLSVQENVISSELTLIRNGNFGSPECKVSNRNGVERTEDNFQQLGPNPGKQLEHY